MHQTKRCDFFIGGACEIQELFFSLRRPVTSCACKRPIVVRRGSKTRGIFHRLDIDAAFRKNTRILPFLYAAPTREMEIRNNPSC